MLQVARGAQRVEAAVAVLAERLEVGEAGAEVEGQVEVALLEPEGEEVAARRVAGVEEEALGLQGAELEVQRGGELAWGA